MYFASYLTTGSGYGLRLQKEYWASDNKSFKLKDVKKLLEEEIKWVTAGKRANCVQHLAEEEKACFWDTDSMETPSSSIQHQQVILFKDVRLNSNTVPALYITFIFCPS